MTRLHILYILLLLAAATAHAARPWSAGDLTPADFTDTPVLPGIKPYLGADIEINHIPSAKAANYTIEATAVMYPEHSYLPDSYTRADLRTLQVDFDLLEVLTRRLQAELSAGLPAIQADRRLAYYRTLYKTERTRMLDQTAYGTLEPQLQQWEYDMRRDLEQIAQPPRAHITPTPWSYGFFGGIGITIPLADLRAHFSPGCLFSFGLQGAYRRLRAHTDIAYATPSLRTPSLVPCEYQGQDYRANVNNTNLLQLGFGIGYTLLDTKRISLTPYAGAHWTGYFWTARPMIPAPDGSFTVTGLQQRMQLDDFNFSLGADISWHFHSTVTSIPLFGSMREQYTSSLTLRPQLTRAILTDTPSPLKGWLFSISLCYTGLARTLRLQ